MSKPADTTHASGELTFFPQGLCAFYNARDIDTLVHRLVATNAIRHLQIKWDLPPDVAINLSRIALFDVVMYINDSPSMNPEEHRQRHQGPVDDRRQEARTAVAAFAFAGSVLDVDGVDLCFMNSVSLPTPFRIHLFP